MSELGDATSPSHTPSLVRYQWCKLQKNFRSVGSDIFCHRLVGTTGYTVARYSRSRLPSWRSRLIAGSYCMTSAIMSKIRDSVSTVDSTPTPALRPELLILTPGRRPTVSRSATPIADPAVRPAQTP